MKTADYWRGRFSMLEESAHWEAEQTIRDLEEMYLEAQRTVQKEIESWYGRFAKNNQIGLSDARKMLTAGQLEEFKWSVEKYIEIGQKHGLDPVWMKKLENVSARFHVSRLEAIQVEIQQQLELLYGNQVDELDSLLKKVVGNGYTHAAYEVQKGLGLGWDITGLNQKKLEILLSKPWTTDGRTFRDRCWLNKTELVDSLHKNLVQGMLRGDSPEKTIQAIQKQFGVARHKAARLLRTETSYFNACSALQSYKDLDIEQVEIIETLDSRTCETCGGMDGTVIPLAQYEPGVTVPPFHPNCRGTTAPYYDDMDGERAARNAEGKVYYVPANTKYSEWKKAFADGGPKAGLTVAAVDAIMKAAKPKNGGCGVQTVGRIDIEKYRCITNHIITDEVIITPERIQHIRERRGADFLEKYEQYFPFILADPDYIFPDDRANTVIVCKVIGEGEDAINLVLRLVVEGDDPTYKNSILTAIRENKKRFAQRLRNNKPLYKKN